MIDISHAVTRRSENNSRCERANCCARHWQLHLRRDPIQICNTERTQNIPLHHLPHACVEHGRPLQIYYRNEERSFVTKWSRNTNLSNLNQSIKIRRGESDPIVRAVSGVKSWLIDLVKIISAIKYYRLDEYIVWLVLRNAAAVSFLKALRSPRSRPLLHFVNCKTRKRNRDWEQQLTKVREFASLVFQEKIMGTNRTR